jgi:Kef-type K+ transport system membrane component KefB
VIGTACAGKIAGTFGVAMACGMSAREAVVLGVVMNTKGLVELIVLNIGRERKVRSTSFIVYTWHALDRHHLNFSRVAKISIFFLLLLIKKERNCWDFT